MNKQNNQAVSSVAARAIDDHADSARYRWLRDLAVRPGGILEAFVALNALDRCRDNAEFDAIIDRRMQL